MMYPFIKDLTLWARAKVRSEANETGLLGGKFMEAPIKPSVIRLLLTGPG